MPLNFFFLSFPWLHPLKALGISSGENGPYPWASEGHTKKVWPFYLTKLILWQLRWSERRATSRASQTRRALSACSGAWRQTHSWDRIHSRSLLNPRTSVRLPGFILMPLIFVDLTLQLDLQHPKEARCRNKAAHQSTGFPIIDIPRSPRWLDKTETAGYLDRCSLLWARGRRHLAWCPLCSIPWQLPLSLLLFPRLRAVFHSNGAPLFLTPLYDGLNTDWLENRVNVLRVPS